MVAYWFYSVPYFIAGPTVVIILVITRAIYKTRQSLDAIEDARAILDPPGQSLPDQLASRAACNQRLVSAFDIGNTFVSSSPDIHQSFKSEATTLIRSMSFGADTGLRMRNDAAASMALVLSSPSLAAHPGASVPFHALVQCVTLSVVLVSLLGADAEELQPEELFLVAQGINMLWTLSKTPDVAGPPNLLEDINARLHAWMDGRITFQQPLDIVVPAFETAWRVVAGALVHALASPAALNAFSAFYLKPNHAGFMKEEDGVSVEGIVMETLRVHPPTRRIAREVRVERFQVLEAALPCAATRLLAKAMPRWFGVRTEVRRADVEQAHRCASVWGTDAGAFDARRWSKNTLNDEQKKSMFAFGAGKMKCVAQQWAPMMVGVIVATILETMKVEGFEVKPGERVGGRDDWAGWEFRPVKGFPMHGDVRKGCHL